MTQIIWFGLNKTFQCDQNNFLSLLSRTHKVLI